MSTKACRIPHFEDPDFKRTSLKEPLSPSLLKERKHLAGQLLPDAHHIINEKNLLNALLPNQLRQFLLIVTIIDDIDILVMLGEERQKGIGVGILDDQ